MRTRLLALLTALALVAGACGSDSDESSSDDTTTTTEAARSTEGGSGSTASSGTEGDQPADGDGTTFGDVVDPLDQETARFEGTMVLVGTAGSQLSEPVEVFVAGSLDPEHDATQISMDMSGIAQAALGAEGDAALPDAFADMFDEPLEIISIGGTSWMRFPLLTMMSGVETDWLEVPPDETGELTAGLGLGSNVTPPTGLIDQLREADAEVDEVGTETVRGQETTHYRMQVDVSQLAEDLPAEEQEQLRDELGGLDEPLPVEVWVGDDGRLYRYTVEVAGAADDPDVESATLEFEFFDHGADLSIEAPPEDEVTAMEDLGDLFGGAEGTEGTEGG